MTGLDVSGEPPINSGTSLQRWIDALPVQRQRQAAIVIAARATLRMLPSVGQFGDAGPHSISPQYERLALALFWATALARAAGRYPTHADGLPVAKASKSAKVAGNFGSEQNWFAGDAAGYAARLVGVVHVPSEGASEAADHAAGVTSRFDADRSFWRSLSADVDALEEGRSASEISGDPLWPQGAPDWAKKHWTRWRSLVAEEHWRPWLDWYQRRLVGEELSEEIELLFATLPVDPREKDPAEQNALLAQAIARLTKSATKNMLEIAEIADSVDAEIVRPPGLRQTPNLPRPRPAAIEPIAADGKIRLRNGPIGADLDARALNAALRALKQQFADLVDSLEAESNIDRRATASLRRLVDRIPTKRPTQEQLFRLAHEQEKLEAYAASVVAEWPSTLAADYLAVTRAFDSTVRQFPKWREFKANAEKDRLTAEQREATPRIAAEFADALRETEAAEFVEQEIASIVSEMASRLAAQRDAETTCVDPIAAGADLLAEDLVTSMENVVKAIAEAAISPMVGVAGTAKRAGKKFASHADKSVVREAGKWGDAVGPALTRWAKRALPGAKVGGGCGAVALVIDRLTHTFPQIGDWLQHVAACLL